MGRLPGLGQGCRPVGGVCMQAALVTVSELVRAGLGRLVRRLGWASGWSVAGELPAMARHCLWANSKAGLALAARGRGCSGQAALVVAGRCKLLCANTNVNHLQQSWLAPALRREANDV